jgi:hypothetical protein
MYDVENVETTRPSARSITMSVCFPAPRVSAK